MSVEFSGRKSIITPEGVFIIGTYDENGVPNAMNAAWGMQSDEGEITLMLAKHKTTENFEKTGAFTVAFGTVRLFEKYSIYTKRIAQSGDLLTHDSDQAVLTLMHLDSLIRDKYPRVQIDATLREVASVVAGTDAAVLAVLDRQGRFQGMIDLATARKPLLDPSKYDSWHVYNIMESAPDYIYAGEKMESVMAKFDRTGAWRLPVVDADRKYLGFISKSRLLMAYRAELKEIASED